MLSWRRVLCRRWIRFGGLFRIWGLILIVIVVIRRWMLLLCLCVMSRLSCWRSIRLSRLRLLLDLRSVGRFGRLLVVVGMGGLGVVRRIRFVIGIVWLFGSGLRLLRRSVLVVSCLILVLWLLSWRRFGRRLRLSVWMMSLSCRLIWWCRSGRLLMLFVRGMMILMMLLMNRCLSSVGLILGRCIRLCIFFVRVRLILTRLISLLMLVIRGLLLIALRFLMMRLIRVLRRPCCS